MSNKYQEALDWIKYELSGNYATDNWFQKKKECLNNLQDLIDEYSKIQQFDRAIYFNADGYVVNGVSYEQLENALDKACELLADCEKDSCYYCPLKEGCIVEGQKNPAYQGLLKDETYRECNKEDWKKYLLGESNDK